MTHVERNPATLTEKVREIAFTNSALPPSPSAETLCGIIHKLINESHSKRLSSCDVFGSNSVCSRITSFLISQGCPSSTLVENSFAAAAAHSELGKMFQWFAQSIVQLFVHGVESGVRFPREWEEAVRTNPKLTHYSFELQGFSVLYTYVLCNLAAVETSVTGKTLRSEYSVTERNSTTQLPANRMTAGDVDGLGEKRAQRDMKASNQSCEMQPLVDEVLELLPETETIKNRPLESPIRTAWIDSSPEVHMKNESIAIKSKPLASSLTSKEARSLTSSANSAHPPKPCKETMESCKVMQFHLSDRLQEGQQQQQQQQQQQNQQQQQQSGGFSRNKVVRDPLLGVRNAEVPLLEIRSTRFDPKSSERTSSLVSSLVREPPDKPNVEPHPIKRRLVNNGPRQLQIELLEEEDRARELRRVCGGKNIVNYSKRDAQICGDHVQFLRGVLDAQCDAMDEEDVEGETEDVLSPLLFPEP